MGMFCFSSFFKEYSGHGKKFTLNFLKGCKGGKLSYVRRENGGGEQACREVYKVFMA